MEIPNRKKKYILVDGSNVALFYRTRKRSGRFNNIQAITCYLNELSKIYPLRYQILIDASLRYKIDNEQALESAIQKGKIIQCPSRTETDYFILEYFKRHENQVIVISNDNFSNYSVSNLRQCRFAIILDEIIFNPAIELFWTDSEQKIGGEIMSA